MLNRYFDPKEDPDFIYANAAFQNVNYALISLHYIFFEKQKFDIGVYHDEHTYYFYHIQNVLTACGNLTNVFYNKSKWDKKEITQRCARLRKRFDITHSKYKLIFLKSVRNTNEHFDERYQEANGELGDLNLLNDNTDEEMKTVILENYHLRTYDVVNQIYYTYDRNRNPIKYDLNELHKELSEMRNKLDKNLSTCVSYQNEMPDEALIK